jgi:hypothetical protein
MEAKDEREAYWRGHVLAWRASGQTQRAYCSEHDLKPHSLSYWQLRLRAEGPDSTQRPPTPLTLVRAIVPADVPPTSPRMSLLSPAGWRLEFTTLPPPSWVTELWRGQA